MKIGLHAGTPEFTELLIMSDVLGSDPNSKIDEEIWNKAMVSLDNAIPASAPASQAGPSAAAPIPRRLQSPLSPVPEESGGSSSQATVGTRASQGTRRIGEFTFLYIT